MPNNLDKMVHDRAVAFANGIAEIVRRSIADQVINVHSPDLDRLHGSLIGYRSIWCTTHSHEPRPFRGLARPTVNHIVTEPVLPVYCGSMFVVDFYYAVCDQARPDNHRTGGHHVYLGLRNEPLRDEADVPLPIAAQSDDVALRILAGRAPKDELCCEPELAAAGAALGYRMLLLPNWVLPMRAVLALTAALGPLLDGVERETVEPFIEAAAAFHKAAPWRYWTDSDSLAVTVSGAQSYELEGSIMGNGEATFGLALYRGKGALERMAALASVGLSALVSEDGYAVTFDDGPAFAAKALDDAFGLPRVPTPMRVEKGRPGKARRHDLAMLTVVLRAVARLTPKQREARYEMEVRGRQITVEVRAPEPEA